MMNVPAWLVHSPLVELSLVQTQLLPSSERDPASRAAKVFNCPSYSALRNLAGTCQLPHTGVVQSSSLSLFPLRRSSSFDSKSLRISFPRCTIHLAPPRAVTYDGSISVAILTLLRYETLFNAARITLAALSDTPPARSTARRSPCCVVVVLWSAMKFEISDERIPVASASEIDELS